VLAGYAEVMLLRARSLDRRARAALRRGVRFTVHSVFERALNFNDGDGAIIGLVGPNGGNGPATLVLEGLPAAGFSAARIKRGAVAEVDDAGRLLIARDLIVDPSMAELWLPPRIQVEVEPERVRANVDQAARLAYALRGGDGLGGLLACLHPLVTGPAAEPPARLSPLLRAAWSGLAELIPAWRAGDAAAVGPAAGRLVGLGPGQTPSGDDLLAGLMVVSDRMGARQVVPLRAACLESAAGRTTDLGLARLRYAAEGDLDERSELALAALLRGGPAEVEAATRELLAFGHSSGLDILVGILLGIGLAQPLIPPRDG